MFRFENINYLYLLLSVIPLILLLFYFQKHRNDKLTKLVDLDLLQAMMPGYRLKTGFIKNIIFSAIVIFSIIALANPQWSNKRVKIKAQSSDIIIALDISQSMLAQDISPNRLERTKKIIQELILKMKGNRIGLIFFAGEAFLKMPLSPDYSASILFVKGAAPYMIENQGTAIEESIKIAESAFSKDNKNQKALIIFSDGEDHDGNAIQAAKNAGEKGFNVFTVAVGTYEGGYIPYINEYGIETYKKDEQGKVIKTKVNKALLANIAEDGNAYFFDISDSNILKKLVSKLEKIEKREITQRSFTDYNSHFAYFVFIAIALLILYILFPELDRKKLKNDAD